MGSVQSKVHRTGSNPRPTIGVMINALELPNEQLLFTGAVQAARAHQVNLIWIAGGRLAAPFGYEIQRNVLYEWVGQPLDGLVICGSLLDTYVSKQDAERFYRRFASIPQVIMGTRVEGVPYLDKNNYQSMQAAVEHLIHAHGYRRIAFVCGPASHPAAQERLRAYKDALAKHGLSVREELISPPCVEWMPTHGAAMARLFLGERGLRPQVDVDAIVASNDMLAWGVMSELQAQGIVVPEQVAVVGYDDADLSQISTPPLTTVQAPFDEVGRRAVELVLAQIKGEAVPLSTMVEARLVVRTSCGCSEVEALLAASSVGAGKEGKGLAASREAALVDMARAIEWPPADREWLGRLWDAAAADLGGSTGAWSRALESALRRWPDEQAWDSWQRLVSVMRRHVQAAVPDSAHEELWHQARVAIAQFSRRAEARRGQQARQAIEALRRVGQELSASADLDGLASVILRELPLLDIPAFYLSLYDKTHEPIEQASLRVAYDELGHVLPGDPETRFPARQWVPADRWPQDRPFVWVVEPLFSRQEQFGLAVFEAGARSSDIYELLSRELAAVLKGVLTAQERQRLLADTSLLYSIGARLNKAATLQEICHAAALPGLDSGADSATLFAFDLDADGKPVELEVAAVWEEKELPMLPAGTRLRIQEVPVARFLVSDPDNPLLISDVAHDERIDPSTRAIFERARQRAAAVLPLTLGGRWVGALVIPWRQPHEFRPGDQQLYKSIADQTAVAVETRRLFDQTQARAARLQAASEISRATSSILDLDTLLPQTVELIRQRFDLYYVGLFLVDEAGEWAVLRAASGEAGRQMLAGGHRLQVGGASMIGRCVANGEARIALDVGAEAVRFDNPSLPQTRSEMALPLISQGRTRGALTIQSAQAAAFSQEDIRVLQTMADQLANAVENAHLFQQMQTRTRELALVNEMSQALSAVQTAEAVFDHIHRYTAQLMDATNLYVALYDPGQDEINFPLYVDGESKRQVSGRRMGAGMTEYVIGTRRPLLIAAQVAERCRELGIEAIGQSSQSWLGAPMVIGDRVLGVIAVQSYTTPSVYGEHDRDLLVTVASQSAIALENVRLLEQTRQRVNELATLNEMGREFSAALKSDELYRLVHRQVSRLFEASSFYIATYEEGSAEWTLVLRQEDGRPGELGVHKLGEGFTSHIIRTRAPILLHNEAETVAFHQEHGLSTVGNPAKSWMGIPLIAAGRLVGVMAVQSYYQDNLYSSQDLALFTTIGAQVAIAVQNARLVDQMQRALAQTQSLYQASADLNAASGYPQLLAALRQYTVLGQADVLAEVQVFDMPWVSDRQPRWNTIMARWSKFPEGTWPSRYDLAKLEVAALWRPDAPLVVEDTNRDGRLSEPVRQLYVRAYQGQSLIYAPLVVGGQWIGNVSGLWSQPRRFEEADVQRLLALTGQAATVVQSLVQLEESRARAQELAALNELSQTLASRLSVNQVLEDVYRGVSRLLDVSNFYIALYDPYRNEVSFPIDVSESVLDKEIVTMPAERGITGHIIRSRASVLIADNVGEWLEAHGMEHVGEPSLSWLGVPMLLGDQVLGVIALQSYTTPRKFGEHERDLLTAIASQSAIAIQNARLFEETQGRVRREQILREITARVRGATDPDLILRTAVRELGVALGRPAFARLGSVEELARPPASAPPSSAPSTTGAGSRSKEAVK